MGSSQACVRNNGGQRPAENRQETHVPRAAAIGGPKALWFSQARATPCEEGPPRASPAQRANPSPGRTVGPLGRQWPMRAHVYQGVALAWENHCPFGAVWRCLDMEQKWNKRPSPKKPRSHMPAPGYCYRLLSVTEHVEDRDYGSGVQSSVVTRRVGILGQRFRMAVAEGNVHQAAVNRQYSPIRAGVSRTTGTGTGDVDNVSGDHRKPNRNAVAPAAIVFPVSVHWRFVDVPSVLKAVSAIIGRRVADLMSVIESGFGVPL